MTRPIVAVPAPLVDAIRASRRARPIKLRVIAEAVMTLSDMFTGRTVLRPGYMAKPSLRAAYIHYYLPLHYLKVRRVLDELATYASISGPALDFGCGPGSAALALAAMAQPSPPIAAQLHPADSTTAEEGHPTVAEIDLCDIVDEVLDDAGFFLRTLAPGMRTQRFTGRPTRRYRLILAANVLSEMRDPGGLREMLDRSLEPDGHMVVVEPAMREPTRRLMSWRDDLVAAGFRIAAPCLGIARCPMRATEDMWCHQDVPWSRPAIIDEIDRRTGLNKESLKYSYLVITRTGRTLGDLTAHWRVVSDRHAAKGRVWSFLCGREGPLCRCELLTRHRAPERRDFERARRGDLLTIDPPVAGASARLGETSKTARV